jgi:hypothetical protein
MPANNSLIVQIRRGTTAQTASYTGPLAELIVDTDQKTISVQDGVTNGGIYLARQDFAQAAFNAANNSGSGASANSTYLQGGLNSANANISLLFAYSLSSNANASSLNTYVTAAYSQANSASANTVYITGGLNTANANISYLYAVNQAQNTYAQSVNTYAYSAYAYANTLSAGVANSSGYLPNSIIFANNTGYLSNTSNLQYFTSNNTLSVGGNLNLNNKTVFNFSGDEQIISQDTSLMRTGSWSTIASGTLYTLVGEPIMWYWIHNCAIDPATGNFLARDDAGPVTVWALTESMVIKTWISPPSQTVNIPTFWVQTSAQDTNNGLFTTGGITSNSLNLTKVITPISATGFVSPSGGSLSAGNYYVRIVGVDVNGQTSLPSAESTVATTTGSTSSINYIIPVTPGVSTYRIYVTQTSGVYTSGYFTFNPDYLTNYFTLTTLTGTTAGILPTTNSTGSIFIPYGSSGTPVELSKIALAQSFIV